ncbi:MAG: phospholipid carrier-dependent glycosyltransferase [Anaerolineae bacterium]|nr:phospholipid carrier-dependent glycosyltransferase [Anaerolineae bacterium]
MTNSASRRPRDVLITIVLGLALLALALATRHTSLGAFAWPDEQTWLERSAAFVLAVERGDLAGTYLADHPGVVPMWGFGTALALRARLTGDHQALETLAAGEYEGDYPAQLAAAAAFTVVLTSLTVAAAYLLLIPLLGRAGAALTGLLLALDPFYLTHSRIVHVDGILASAMLLSVLSLLVYLKRRSTSLSLGVDPERAPLSIQEPVVASERQRAKQPPHQVTCPTTGLGIASGAKRPRPRNDRFSTAYLLLSGFTAGLALLTKTPALFLVPFTALVLGGQWLCRRLGRDGWGKLGQLAGAFGIWLAVAWGTFLALWPATWSDPLFFLWRLYRASRWGVVVSHGTNFFLGRVVEDPGPLFYPVVLAFRLSPVVAILLPVGIVLAALAWRRGRDVRLPLAGYAFLLFFTIMVSLAAKKGDRYLLPVFPVAAVVTGWTAMELVAIARAQGWMSRRVACAAAAGLLLLASLLWLPLAPHYGAYFNPLAGGGAVAARTFPFGQGEGLELAAEYLNARHERGDLVVVTFYPPQFRYYFHGEATSLRRGEWDETWQFADYVVFYISQVQRDLPTPELVHFFLAQEPEYVARIDGVDFARVYRSPLLLSGEGPGAERALDSRVVGDKLALTSYALSDPLPAPGDTWYVTLAWQATEQLDRDYSFETLLVDDAGQVVWQEIGPPFDGQFPTWWWRPGRTHYQRYHIPLPAALPPGNYRLLARVFDPAGGQTLPPAQHKAVDRPGYLDVIGVRIAP